MRNRGRSVVVPALVLTTALSLASSAQAYDVTEDFSVEIVVAGLGQCLKLSERAGVVCGGALPVRPAMGLRPTDNDELYVKLGFAVGNGLNEISPFTLRSWAADLQDDVQDINGLWDYLLNAWYKHRFSLGEEASLDATFGVIDATDYLDDNAYSNDEYSQFMNEALVNGPQAFLPSYAPGGALALDVGRWSARAVVMGIGKNDDGNNVVFYGGQLGYRLETPLGEGNYRLLIVGANRAFLDPSGTREEFRLAGAFSIDQQLGETFGVFLRIGWQSDRAAVNYDAIYSGGLNIFGGAWGRENDNIGLAYGYLNGGNQDLRGTHVAEVYYRLAATEHFGLTVDAQYMFDGLRTGGGPRGVILGLRATIEY